MSEYSSSNPKALLEGFVAAGGWYDDERFALREIEGQGLGAVALQDLPEQTLLFRVPATCILSPGTSSLRDRLTAEQWNGLNSWAKLILVLMWETARGSESPWEWYLSSLPTRFATPMFWSETEREGLIGTEIEHRVGRAEAETLFHDSIEPLLQARPDIFGQGTAFYDLNAFHIQGSRILSRSFNISAIATEQDDEESTLSEQDGGEEVIAMIPIADALNATNRNTARLVNEDEEVAGQIGRESKFGYTMMSTAEIASGSQIFNTYHELPNAEYLRKYGYVLEESLEPDIVKKLADANLLHDFPLGNSFDDASVDGDRVLHIAALARNDKADLSERVEWWLEEDQDDSFSISLSGGIDPAFHVFARILLSDTDWRKAEKSSRLPSIQPNKQTTLLLQRVLEDRLDRYQSSIQDDIAAVKAGQSAAVRAALIVRIGEKRALLLAKKVCESYVEPEAALDERKKKRAKVQ